MSRNASTERGDAATDAARDAPCYRYRSMDPDAKIELITPEQAAALLLLNTNNRRLLRTKVLSYANKMRAGDWMFTGQAHVIIGDDNVLLNGQHTLSAVVESGVPIRTVVVRGVDPAAFSAIDIGLKRSAADAFKLADIARGRQLAGIIRAVDDHDSMLRHGGSSPRREDRLDPDQVVATYMHDPGSWNDVKTAAVDAYQTAERTQIRIGTAVIGAFLYIGRRAGADPKALQRFVDAVVTDSDHKEGQPATTLRRWLASLYKGGKGGTSGTTPKGNIIALASWIKGYNAAAEGRMLSRMYAWTQTSDFPTFTA